jgi:hypothetical protein
MPTQPHEQGDGQQFIRQQGFWWLIMLGLLVWNVIALWPTHRPEVQIPYTTFVAPVGYATSLPKRKQRLRPLCSSINWTPWAGAVGQGWAW